MNTATLPFPPYVVFWSRLKIKAGFGAGIWRPGNERARIKITDSRWHREDKDNIWSINDINQALPSSVWRESFTERNHLFGSAMLFRFSYLQPNTTSTEAICLCPVVLKGLQRHTQINSNEM